MNQPSLESSVKTAGFAAIASVILAACNAVPPAQPMRTTVAITPADARSRIYLVADDSMRGRRAGEAGNYKMTSYLAHEMARLGLEPGGPNGTFFQTVPIVTRAIDSVGTAISVRGERLRIFSDFAPLRPNTTERYGASLGPGAYPTIYGGRAGDSTASLPNSEISGRIVVLDAPLGDDGKPSGVWSTPGAVSVSRFGAAAGIAIAALEFATTGARNALRASSTGVSERGGSAARPFAFVISSAAAMRMMGGKLDTLRLGARGIDIDARAAFIDRPVSAPARNVIAILRGADPDLRNEYVAIGAHSDHVGTAAIPLNHDSLRARYRVMQPDGAQRRGPQPGNPTPAQLSRIAAIRDSIRRIRPERMDSIYNGADDDGSGSVALLEIAEAFAAGERPRRSIVFIWHTAEELGLLGSAWFTEHPTVPRESIVAQLNMDLVGRAAASNIPGDGPHYVQVIGSKRLSTDLGNVLDSVNAARPQPMSIDYSWDAPGHVMSRYCRSDHFSYARRGIPVAFISRGYSQDYHVLTDEPQYIDYAGLARVASFVRDVAFAVADRRDRVRVDGPLLNPVLPCRH